MRKISVIGLGYVGLPVAVAFAQKSKVIGFDINKRRIENLKRGYDSTKELSTEELRLTDLFLTSDPQDLKQADFHIVAVPTPIDEANNPDLSLLFKASRMVGGQLKSGDIVVYESTVYPGATEEDCVPVLEQYSGLICGKDFFVGYSPERINPGDKEKTFTKIKKIVSGQTKEVLKIVSEVYASVVTAGVFEASSIKVAEAAKVIENSQRDLNIAFANELSKIFRKMEINTYEVLAAAETKWNFLPFKPGLVGGHCIGVDPYYLTHKAQKIGYHPEVILAGRRINDSMGKYVAEMTVKEMIRKNIPLCQAKVGILGFSFKENCSDVRNTRVIDIVKELKSYYIDSIIHDPIADPYDTEHEYHISLQSFDCILNCTTIIIAVAHDSFKKQDVQNALLHAKVIVDVKNILTNIADRVTL